eukprot:PRCOL_00003754-RA
MAARGAAARRLLAACAAAALAALAGRLAARRAALADPRPRPAGGEARAYAGRLEAAVARARERDLETLGMLIRERTVTIDGQELSDDAKAALLRCHAVLAERFPDAHAAARVDTVSDYSLLYEWEGSDAALDPIVLVAHLDVVPVSPEQHRQWSRPPFGGVVEGGVVWGRGALDVKGRVVAHLAAVEALLAAGVERPRRTVFLAYGHDEEIGGAAGARAIAAEIERRLEGRRIAALVDEGGAVASGAVPGMGSLEGAMVGVAEKGVCSVKLRASSMGGHAAWPPLGGTPVTAVARAVAAWHAAQPPPRVSAPVVEMLERASPLVGEPWRTLFANLDLAGGLLARALASHSEKANALVRTTYAATIARAGEKNNVVPASAEVTLNLRVLPGDTLEGALEAVRRVVEPLGVRADLDASAMRADPAAGRVSDNLAAWEALERSFHRVYGFDGVVVLPFIMLGTTDSKHFVGLSDAVYRVGQRMSDAAIASVHGVDERETAEGIAEQALLFESFIELYAI